MRSYARRRLCLLSQHNSSRYQDRFAAHLTSYSLCSLSVKVFLLPRNRIALISFSGGTLQALVMASSIHDARLYLHFPYVLEEALIRDIELLAPQLDGSNQSPVTSNQHRATEYCRPPHRYTLTTHTANINDSMYIWVAP